MNRQDLAKDWIKKYRHIKNYLNSLQDRIKKAQKTLTSESGMKGISYEGITTSKSYKFNSIVEDQVINELDKLEQLKLEAQVYKDIVKRIEDAVESLQIEERRVIKLYYMNEEKITWQQVADIVKSTDAYCRNKINPRALKDLSIALFGDSEMIEMRMVK